ncbi:HSF-type DNA-binding protein [Nitzschia inconspicua]|uniref:HSF-type DNA-binding protein n=1 Tax=Nitzschia inconspicua TaxID=303405 RepID=A0A9K3KJU3_9STRA|nr:HSF-type DNA-binding protein [Nitzschia inconspicua]
MSASSAAQESRENIAAATVDSINVEERPNKNVQAGEEGLQLQDIADSGVEELPESEMGDKEKQGNHDDDDDGRSTSNSGSIKDHPQEERPAKVSAPRNGPSSKDLAPSSNASSSASPSRSRFPDKLHRLLDHCSNDPVESQIVSWMGIRAFKVHHAKQFASTILPRYFSTTTYKSFQRNLNLWGFTCIAKGPRRGVTFHPFFVRGNEDELSSNMKRSGDPPKSTEQSDQNVLLSSMGSSLTSDAAATATVIPPGLTNNAISALAALTSSTRFPAAFSTMGAGQVVPLLPSLGLAGYGTGVAATSPTGGGKSEEPRSGRSNKNNSYCASSSSQVKKRKAAPKSGPPAMKEKQATTSLPTSSLHNQRASYVNGPHQVLGGEDAEESKSGKSAESKNAINSQVGGIDIHQVLNMTTQSSQGGRINAASSNPAVILSGANTFGELSEYIQKMLQETQSYPSNHVHPLLALSNDSNINVQQLLSKASETHTNHLLDTSKLIHLSGGNAGLLANDAFLPEFDLLLRQQELMRQLQQEEQSSLGEGSSIAALLASLEGTRKPNRFESLLKSEMQEGRQSRDLSLDQQLVGAAQMILQKQQQKTSVLQQLQEERRQTTQQQDQQATHLRQLQQEQQSTLGGGSSITALLASLEGTRKPIIESLLQSKMQEGRQSRDLSLDQQFVGERLALEQATQMVLQQQQEPSVLQQLREERRQITQQQDQQASHLQQTSLQQLLQQLHGGASSLPPSSLLLPQVPEYNASPAAATERASAAVSSPSLSMVQLSQLLQQSQHPASSQAQIAAASNLAGNQLSSQLQHLLQSLVTDGTAASSALYTSGSHGWHSEGPRHQEEQLREFSGTTSQQLLQLLQAQQIEAILASRAQGTGQNNNEKQQRQQ